MVGVLGGSAAVVLALVVVAPARSGWILLLGAAGIVAVALGLRSPVLACVYLLVATFFRLAVPGGTLPVDPFVLAFAGVLASTWLWTRPWRRGLSDVRLDPITCAIGLYVGWNVLSAVVPHAYPAGPVDQPGTYSLTRFLIIGIVMPFVMFLIGRRLFVDARAIRVLLWTVLAAAGYSALVSVLQFRAPEFVWPRYIAEDPNWADRAVGVFNQPVVNGLVLVIGFVVAMLIASHDTEGAGPRVLAGAIAVLIVYGVYLTHTRVVWLSFGLVVLLGVLLAKGFRTGFVLVAVVTAAAVLRNWSTFISADRTAGGVRSPEEIQDRLNNVATSFSAFTDEPIVGAGIGRFIAVNTYHHQAWSAETPWQRGFGISSHLDSLGILVELGLVGLVLWLLVSALLYSRLVRVVRRLPVGGMYDRALGLTALLCLLAQTITGLTVDLRFFDFPNIAVMLLAGAAIGWQRARAEADLARGAADEGPAPAPSPQVPEAVRS
ncbi:O-antigen ligase family protein [Trujillonella endophytica]|uniref:O-antigen ligase like membrane protein n=1 Tax=Trujillonella endophytica TaxID=673521 RepID=A0A1H8W0H2_9ACTN|nr:O-antigen ligase family protein [Trujillella endophytica]SEP21090.1 O-antigen ligase like membrane protein [Trujillella endophytica]